MYKIITVDDEPLSLKRFAHIICKEPRVELVASFSDPFEALEYIKNNTVDIAFLDIEMPELNGLMLAERIGEVDPYVSIIFLTAFDQYALDAFRAHAIGYLLKPLDLAEFTNQINKLELSKMHRQPKVEKPVAEEKRLIVNCLGPFTCYSSDHPDEPITFRTAKTAELFAFLIHNYKSAVTKYHILDSIFPDMDYEKSNKLFYVSCSYLRSAFSKYDIVDILIRDNDSYRINTNVIDCDYISFMNYYDKINSLTEEEFSKAVSLYRGEYFLGRNYEWTFESKPYIDNLFEMILFKYSDSLVNNGNYEEAVSALEKFLILDPLRENTVTKLVTVLIKHNQKEKAVQIYNTFKSKLKDQLDMEPSSSLRNLIK